MYREIRNPSHCVNKNGMISWGSKDFYLDRWQLFQLKMRFCSVFSVHCRLAIYITHFFYCRWKLFYCRPKTKQKKKHKTRSRCEHKWFMLEDCLRCFLCYLDFITLTEFKVKYSARYFKLQSYKQMKHFTGHSNAKSIFFRRRRTLSLS